MSVKDWAETDYYGALGVASTASDAEIGRAYRALAKQLHPDRSGSDSAESDRFSEVAVAYSVLSDPQLRADYDRVERHDGSGVRRRPISPMGTVPRAAPPPMIRWTHRKAVAAIVLGGMFILAGIVTSMVMIRIHAHDARDSRERISVDATVARSDRGDLVLMFRTADDRLIIAALPERVNPGVAREGDSFALLYRSSDPTDVVADESHFARDFTLWFVVVKFMVGGPMVLWLGIHQRAKLRRLRFRQSP